MALVVTAAQLLAVHGDDLALGHIADCTHPLEKTGLKLLWVQRTEDPPERIMGWYPVWQLQKRSQPFFFGFAKRFHRRVIIATTDNCADPDDQYVDELMAPPSLYTWIVQSCKMLAQRPCCVCLVVHVRPPCGFTQV